MTTLQSALNDVAPKIEAKPVHLSANFYDPAHHISELIATPTLLSSIRSSMAWYLDNQYVKAVRDMYWATYEEAQKLDGIDGMAEFINACKERDFMTYVLTQQGFDDRGGPAVIRLLARLRYEWHDATGSQEPMPDLEDLLAAEKPMRLSPLSAAKLRTLATAIADGDAEAERNVYDDLTQREQLRSQLMFEQRAKFAPGMLQIERFVLATDVSTEEAFFYNLPLPMRKRLVQNTVMIVQNAMMRLATDRKVDVLEYAAMSMEGTRAMKAIKAILAQPLFANCED